MGTRIENSEVCIKVEYSTPICLNNKEDDAIHEVTKRRVSPVNKQTWGFIFGLVKTSESDKSEGLERWLVKLSSN